MRVFITGATGFVGGAIASALVAKKHKVKAMSRSESGDSKLKALGAIPVRSQLGDVSSEDLKDNDAIIHAAAYVGAWGSREEFWQANVTGTEQLLSAARTAGVPRFIHIGTEAALFAGQHMRGIDESTPYPQSTPFLYSETKREAEIRVLQANERGFATMSVRPRMVWGPGDATILPEVMRMVAEKKFAWLDGGKALTSTTHIHNLVHAVLLALKDGRGGEAYFVTDDEIRSFREFLTAYLKTQGVHPPDKSLPGWLARGIAALVEGTWRLFRIKKEPPLTRFAAAITSRDCTIQIDKIKQELKYRPVISVDQGLAQMPRL